MRMSGGKGSIAETVPRLLNALGNDSAAFANVGANAGRFGQAAQSLQSFDAHALVATASAAGRLNAGASQAALGNPQVFSAMLANPGAFSAVSQHTAALATLAGNSKALTALSQQPNMAALMANPSFSAALNRAGASGSNID
jgi:hypothetical protein